MTVEEKMEWKAAQKPVAIVGAAFITVDGELKGKPLAIEVKMDSGETVLYERMADYNDLEQLREEE